MPGLTVRYVDSKGDCQRFHTQTGMLRLLDEHGTVIKENNKEGELYLKGPAMMLGYLDNPEATAEMIGEDGWLKTGDIGYRDQGKYYVIDRKKVCHSIC